MNQERIEAAAKAVANLTVEVPYGISPVTDEGYKRDAAEILAAADALMFSDEALERAGDAVDNFTMHEYGHAIPLSDRRDLVNAVIAALKGGDA